jgi:hypothetical protein
VSHPGDKCRRRTTAALAAPVGVAFSLVLTLAATATAQSESESGREPAPRALVPLPAPSLSFYGTPGLMDMPSAEMMPDGQFATGISWFAGQSRINLSFQAFPWMSATFRYNGIENWNLGGFATYYDRGFDVRFRLAKEGTYRPEITMGLQDFAGTGIYAAEYFTATKRFATPGWGARDGRLKVTAGIGWGRLGSYNNLGSTGNRPPFDPTDTGGQLSYDQWFRGPFALFGGVEWTPDDRWGFKVEYSSDAYTTETQTTNVFERKSPFNFGVEYQWRPSTRIGVYYMYGSEIGVNAQIQLNPRHAPIPPRVAAPEPIRPRPARASDPVAWGTTWTTAPGVTTEISDRLAAELKADGLILEKLTLTADSAELRYRNPRYMSHALATGRAARAMTRTMPVSVETFRIVLVNEAMGLSAVIIRRSDLEALEFDPLAVDALLAVTGFADAATPADGMTATGTDLYPDFNWSLAPYFAPAYFDPSKPFRLDVGVDLSGGWRPGPGWEFSGTLRQRLAGNVKNGRPSNSKLPHVRTDQVLYAQYGTTLNELYGAYYWRPGSDFYARVTAGYLETMYGGVSAELLWKPVGSRLGLGIEANYVVQRDFNQRLGFRDYSVATGHGSVYYEFGDGYEVQIDAGRYLAGDIGATFSAARTFANGWEVGAFFTLTDVSAADFGEGSFDKGIWFRMPLDWFVGTPSRQRLGTTIRPVQRDGGQMVRVPGRLYDKVRDAHRQALSKQWATVWE